MTDAMGAGMRRLMMSAALVAILSVPESALADSENMIGKKHLLCAAALTVWGRAQPDDADKMD